VSEFPKRVLDTVERYRMFRDGDRVGIAVSGGADSVVLLRSLVELAPRWNLSLQVLHVNHQLRGEDSDGDARFVAELARGMGLELESETADVREIARQSTDNLEQSARQVRYRLFH
jgi:tRNA(Ile)-lysidine synthase